MLSMRRWAASAAAGMLALGAVAGAPGALAQMGTGPGGDARCRAGSTGLSDCVVEVTVPGQPGGPGQATQPVVRDDEPKRADFCEINTPGDQQWQAPINCETNFDPVNDCIWTQMSPQPAPPPGADPTRGAWEQCNPVSGANPFDPRVKTRWMESTGTAGEASPEVAARQVVAQLGLKGIEIGMVPYSVEEEGMGAVGLPAWMWVENTDDPQAWGPYTVTKNVDGLAVTATARPVHVTWDMGDGTQVVCQGPGTPYEQRFGKQESPTCGHTYMEMSDPYYKLTAITTWSVEWSAAGQSGVIETVTRSSRDVQIGEFHALNVTPRG